MQLKHIMQCSAAEVQYIIQFSASEITSFSSLQLKWFNTKQFFKVSISFNYLQMKYSTSVNYLQLKWSTSFSYILLKWVSLNQLCSESESTSIELNQHLSVIYSWSKLTSFLLRNWSDSILISFLQLKWINLHKISTAEVSQSQSALCSWSDSNSISCLQLKWINLNQFYAAEVNQPQ